MSDTYPKVFATQSCMMKSSKNWPFQNLRLTRGPGNKDKMFTKGISSNKKADLHIFYLFKKGMRWFMIVASLTAVMRAASIPIPGRIPKNGVCVKVKIYGVGYLRDYPMNGFFFSFFWILTIDIFYYGIQMRKKQYLDNKNSRIKRAIRLKK